MSKSREEELLGKLKIKKDWRPEDFRYDSYQNGYWHVDTGYFLGETKSVNSLIPTEYWPVKRLIGGNGEAKEVVIKPADWLANVSNGCLVEVSTWQPGRPRIIEDELVIQGGSIIHSPGRAMFNQYLPPPAFTGPFISAKKWIDHVERLYPEPLEHNYFFDCCAHMLQRPEEKANVAMVLAGKQGVGKDMMLLPVKAAIGAHNVEDISPDEFVSPYNSYCQCIMLVINEMRPSKEDYHASSIYEKIKRFSVTPPDRIAISEKYMRMRYSVNVMRMFVTTNSPKQMYIAPNDRRMMILNSPLLTGWATNDYFSDLATWLHAGGFAAVANWLRLRDISAFRPKAPPPRTAAWEEITSGWSAPQDEVAAALDTLGSPAVLFSSELFKAAFDGKEEIRKLLMNRRRLMHRMELSGYSIRDLLPAQQNYNGKKQLTFKLAFIREELVARPEEWVGLLKERGNLLANDVAIFPGATKKEGF
jgi:hypothetical protein